MPFWSLIALILLTVLLAWHRQKVLEFREVVSPFSDLLKLAA
jgi:hypothetical protein